MVELQRQENGASGASPAPPPSATAAAMQQRRPQRERSGGGHVAARGAGHAGCGGPTACPQPRPPRQHAKHAHSGGAAGPAGTTARPARPARPQQAPQHAQHAQHARSAHLQQAQHAEDELPGVLVLDGLDQQRRAALEPARLRSNVTHTPGFNVRQGHSRMGGTKVPEARQSRQSNCVAHCGGKQLALSRRSPKHGDWGHRFGHRFGISGQDCSPG